MRKYPSIAAAAGALLLMWTSPAIAGPTADRTPPALTLPPMAGFVVGTQIGNSTGPNGAVPETRPIQQRVSWRASDASGICGYDVTEIYAGMPPEVLVSNTRRTSFTRATTNYFNDQGGGSLKAVAWKITAHDCAGNTSSKQTVITPMVTQEDGWTYDSSNGGVHISYAGSWAASHCLCWSGDKSRLTTAAGARAMISRTWAKGDQLALVVEKAPNRGRFAVSVDGHQRGIVDTYAAAAIHRSVVWDTGLSAGRHTVTVTNLATPGRPRVDLDAVLFNSGYYPPG